MVEKVKKGGTRRAKAGQVRADAEVSGVLEHRVWGEAGLEDYFPAPQPPAMSDPITLNVGGKLYTTSLATLTSFPDSMLGAMFSGKMPTKRDSQGHCFIDRDGKVFRYILNFLRTSHLDLPEDFQEMGLLRREADFYQVQPLIEALQEKEVELSKAEKNAMLNITLNQRVQTVHFTVREAPQIYSLSSSSMEVFNANIFSTSCLFLKLLGSKLFYCSDGNLSSITSHLQDPNHLTLDWVANVEGLPEEEYTKQNLKRLWVVPANKQINSFQVFMEEVLKIALSDGFCIDSSHPHAVDFMNNKIVRLIRYRGLSSGPGACDLLLLLSLAFCGQETEPPLSGLWTLPRSSKGPAINDPLDPLQLWHPLIGIPSTKTVVQRLQFKRRRSSYSKVYFLLPCISNIADLLRFKIKL
ncbi:BTB/POZ domain-containing protein KCTD21 [Pontoporia blainvillei]|uniref:BTB/POZ domain-containing protein KCTD21 n=1 Tax=Pontoporia blainvillei TaxID=48723 RepID=A0ABX0RZD1_PONBL|nr:BTB/POZ domain-containing protein KCTD21 [Pontoporia blainvillei]